MDSYYLQAVALYRLHRPLEAVNAFNHGKRHYAWYQEENPKKEEVQINYEQAYADLMQQEVKAKFTAKIRQTMAETRKIRKLPTTDEPPKNARSLSVQDEERLVNGYMSELVAERDSTIDKDQQIRVKTMLRNSLDQVAKGIFIECLPAEINALKRRNELHEWAGVNVLKTRLVDFFKNKVSQNQELISKILKIKPIKDRKVLGSDADETVGKLLADQSVLTENMQKLKQKFFISTAL